MMRPLYFFILKTPLGKVAPKFLSRHSLGQRMTPQGSTKVRPLKLAYSHAGQDASLESGKDRDLLDQESLEKKEKTLAFLQMGLMGLLALILGFSLLHWELKTSGIDATVGSLLAPHMTHNFTQGPNKDFRAPQSSPFDNMLGYSYIPQWTQNLESKGYVIARQAGLNKAHRMLVDLGIHPIYIEKNQHGLKLSHESQGLIHQEIYPRFRYPNYQQIPPLVRDTLLYIEDRQILDEEKSLSLNPAISWERLMRAVFDFILDKTISDRNVPGGSTLATQIEKFRHSPDGRTQAPGDKIKQILSASLRSYLLGKNTTGMRQQIILNYINEVPLGAAYGFGEVRGLGEALQVWFKRDFKELNRLLMTPPTSLSLEEQKDQAKSYKQVLALFLSQRRPTYYLLNDPKDLEILTSSYLRLLKGQGMIPSSLADLALDQPLDLIPFTKSRLAAVEAKNSGGSSINKAAYATRVDLQKILGLKTLYQIDRLDLDVNSTLYPYLQERVAARLKNFRTHEGAQSAGLMGERMLQNGQAPTVHYSFTLVENAGSHNAVRVQTDTLEGPLDLNSGGKLELGSTAKLRTLVTYLEVISDIYEREIKLIGPRKPLSASAGSSGSSQESDSLAFFVRSYIKEQQKKVPSSLGSLSDLLEEALKREYSASPYQSFWTGGGRIVFNNFNSDENGLHLSVLEAFQKSNNLVFVRIMKDVVHHMIDARIPQAHAMLKDPHHPLRTQYLDNFIEMESKIYLRRFFREFRGLSSAQRFEKMVKSKHLTSSRLAALILSLNTDFDYLAFRLTMKQHLSQLDDKHIQSLFYSIHPLNMKLVDRAYLARTHPLALWTAQYLETYPQATWLDLLWDSRYARSESYLWLRQKAGSGRQERDLWTMLEREAFQKHILPSWKKQGFPFDSMIPTLASALGSSGDRPAALADLMGAIHNDGILLPTQRIEGMTFGRSTPFETRFELAGQGARRAMRVEVAHATQKAVRQVVEGGTARRLKGSLVKANGQEIPIAAKTGTGDNRLEVYNAQGGLLRSEAKSRTATLIFGIGTRFFGTITAYVDHKTTNVDQFQFTSSLVVQGLKALMSEIAPEVLNQEDPEGILFRDKITH